MITHELSLADIRVGERFRKDYGDLQELATSLKQFGMLQPIICDRNGNLIAGGRRVAAAGIAGLTTVPVTFKDEVDELTAREIELEENIRRKELDWTERVHLVAEVHRLKVAKYGPGQIGRPFATGKEGWSLRDTAAALDRMLSSVSVDLAMDRLLNVAPELVEYGDPRDALKGADLLLSKLKREQAIRKNSSTLPENVWLGDCRDLIKKIETHSVDCVIIDPPYGTEAADQHFDDSPDLAIEVLKTLIPELLRVMKPTAHLYCFFGIKLWHETMELFKNTFHDWLDPIPLVWVKDTEGHVDFTKRPTHSWEPILFVSSGERKFTEGKLRNVLEFDAPKNRDNPAEKPEALIQVLMEKSTIKGEVVLDTFSGCGTVAAVAKRLGRRYIAIEQDNDQWTRSLLRLREVRELEDEPVDDDDASGLDMEESV